MNRSTDTIIEWLDAATAVMRTCQNPEAFEARIEEQRARLTRNKETGV